MFLEAKETELPEVPRAAPGAPRALVIRRAMETLKIRDTMAELDSREVVIKEEVLTLAVEAAATHILHNRVIYYLVPFAAKDIYYL